MSRTFKLDKDPFGCDQIIYTKKKVTIEPGVTILVGTNGAGKTTLIDWYIEEQLKRDKIPNLKYDNLHDGGNHARQRALNCGSIKLLATLTVSSEGEQIRTNTGTMASKIGKFVRDHKDAPELWFMFDALDSGLSIDNIIDIKEQLFQTIIETNPDKDIYIIVAANSYEMCRGEKCLDVRNCKYVQFKTYEAYRKFVLKSRELKNARYGED